MREVNWGDSYVNTQKFDSIKNENERLFAKNFFKHENWKSQPVTINLGGYTYRPDFYDEERDVYIEVIGTRQAYHQNKAKYFKAKEILGDKFEIRSVDGDMVTIKNRPIFFKENYPLDKGPFLTKEEADVFEHAIRQAIIEQKKKLNFSDGTLGKMAFPYIAYPNTKIQALLVGQGSQDKRKPQQMRFSDVLNLCEAVGLSWVDVGREALKAVKTGSGRQ